MPITTPSSASQSTSIDSSSRGIWIGSKAPISERAYFVNSVGYSGGVRPVSAM